MNLSEHNVLIIKIVIFVLIIGYFLYKNYKKTHNMIPSLASKMSRPLGSY